ncbi:MAG: OmpA family protein [Sulfurovum sp.]|nr:OmpA family protein [Sulfurovum sp.]MCB4754083.1 OmpA family protein [Sulfurovum sp.]MCB4761281.1 OmpA family protein [Sulfurovum sp.]
MIKCNRKCLTIITLLIFFLAGCTKDPELQGGDNESNVYNADTINIDESGYSSKPYNSSGNSFQSLYFNFDSYAINGKMDNVITKNVTIIREVNGKKIKIEGNCDEFGTDEYNYALGLKRAKVVKDALIAQGISASQILMVSYGESNPACTEQTNACYAQNRRVDFRFVK